MSHILEEYAKNLGVLISEPIISEHYFPIKENKYIVIYSEENIQSKHYKYYNIVLDLLRPILNSQNIQVIQIDVKNNTITGINKGISNLLFKQYAYIISKSIAYIGSDSVYSHYASSKKIPIINLFGNIYPSISNGYWSDKKQKIDISAPWSEKPCLNLYDPKSEINLIKPEQIAQAFLDLLNIKNKINFKTIEIGDLFLNKIYEVVPTSFHDIQVQNDDIIYLRIDYGFDEISFLQYCNKYKVSIITEQLIQLSTLEKIRNNVKKISIFLNKNSDTIPEKYFEILKIWGIAFQILIKEKNDLGFVKNKYFDQNVNLYEFNSEKPKNISTKTLFFSNKRIFKDGKQYASKAHLDLNKNMVDNKMKILDTNEYWKDQEHFYFYEQD